MTTYQIDNLDFGVLKGKTILITGGVTGIGRATVALAHRKLSLTIQTRDFSQSALPGSSKKTS